MRARLVFPALLIAACNSASPASPVDLGLDTAVARDTTAPPRESSPPADLPTCASPKPFTPTGSPTGWKNFANKLVAAEGAANHRGQDAVLLEGQPQVLIGKFAYGVLDADLKQEDVEIFIQQSPPCGDWISLGTFTTSKDGQYGSQYGLDDDGGRVFFTIPSAQARPVGRYPVRMLVKGDYSQASLVLHVVKANTSTVVFDIDGTLTTDDFQLVAQMFSQLLSGSYQPKPQPDGAEVVKTWASKGYLLLYVTGRPEQLWSPTHAWLQAQSLPPGALRLTNTLAEAMPTSGGVAAYKTKVLQGLRDNAKLSLHAAYGNATTDIEAYANAGIDKSRTYIIGSNGGTQSTVAVETYAKHLATAQAATAAAVQAPPAVGW